MLVSSTKAGGRGESGHPGLVSDLRESMQYFPIECDVGSWCFLDTFDWNGESLLT